VSPLSLPLFGSPAPKGEEVGVGFSVADGCVVVVKVFEKSCAREVDDDNNATIPINGTCRVLTSSRMTTRCLKDRWLYYLVGNGISRLDDSIVTIVTARSSEDM
jgi:hypothetical protein